MGTRRRGWTLAIGLVLGPASVYAQNAETPPAPTLDAAHLDETGREDDPRMRDEGDDAHWLTRPVHIAFFWENDGSLPRPWTSEDGHYTNGLKLDIAWTPPWADNLAETLPFRDHFGENVEGAFGFSVSQLMFTPEDITIEAPQPDDRPYAGWFAFSLYLQRTGLLSERVGMFDHIELDLGVVGPSSGAEALQKFVHGVWPEQDNPEGWDHQLKDEFAINLTLRRKWRFSSGATDNGFEFQGIPSIGGTLGTVYRQIEGSVTARIGWNLPDDYGPRRLADVNSATGSWSSEFGFYFFMRAGARLLEHNIFLDGNSWRDSLSVSKQPFVLELQMGAVAVLWHHLEVGWSQTLLTEEFNGQGGGSPYGAWTIAWVARF